MQRGWVAERVPERMTVPDGPTFVPFVPTATHQPLPFYTATAPHTGSSTGAPVPPTAEIPKPPNRINPKPQPPRKHPAAGRAGTSLYMAPEIVREEPYNEKVDVYSFAVVMYEVFGRTLLLANRTRDEVDALSSRMAGGHRPRRLDRITDDTVWRLITACWAQDALARPAMGQVVTELVAISQAMADAFAAARTPRSGTAGGAGGGRTMGALRGFNISLKSRANTASMKSRSKVGGGGGVGRGGEGAGRGEAIREGSCWKWEVFGSCKRLV